MAFRDQRGFTLLEIIIAIMILAVISVMTAINIQHSAKVKTKVEQDLDDYSAVRDALVIISRDVNLAFHWVDIDEEIKKRLSQEALAAGKPPPFPSPPPDQVPAVPTDQITGFHGEADSLYLTTLSHIRTIADSPESDQAKVGYYVKEVKSAKDGQPTKALIRSEATWIDDGQLDKGGKETVLLENVKELKFRYLGGDDKEWTSSWNSTSTGDAVQSNHFPDAVEITITTNREKREVSLSTVAAVHMPNNDPFQQQASPAPGQPGGVIQATPPPGGPM